MTSCLHLNHLFEGQQVEKGVKMKGYRRDREPRGGLGLFGGWGVASWGWVGVEVRWVSLGVGTMTELILVDGSW